MPQYDGVSVGDRHMRVLVGEPAGPGPHPGVLLAFHRHGYSRFTADVVTRFSEAGFVIAVPDLYHRCGDMPSDEAVKHRRDADVLADMAAGLRYLKGRPDVDSDKLIVAGHCMGGRVAFLTASATPDEFKACLSYYSGGMFGAWGEGPSPFEGLAAIRCPVAGFFGNDDDNPPPAEVDRIEAALARSGIRFEIHRYDGAAHGYMDANRGRYCESAAKDSWAKTFAFLDALRLMPSVGREVAAMRP